MVGGKKLIPPQDSRRGVLVRRRERILSKDEASLRLDAIVDEPSAGVKGLAMNGPDKNGRTALDAASGSQK